jgi:hypothetical protein
MHFSFLAASAALELRPAFQGRHKPRYMIPRRVATRESCPQVTLIVIDAVFLQQLQILFLKGFLAMVLALIPDLFNHVRNGSSPVFNRRYATAQTKCSFSRP